MGLIELSQMQLNVLQVLLENHRDSVIVQEFVITTRAEIAAAINDKNNMQSDVKEGLALYGLTVTGSAIAGIIMAISMLASTVEKEDPIIIGFGGFNAIKRVYS